jgi:hypothetical protein
VGGKVALQFRKAVPVLMAASLAVSGCERVTDRLAQVPPGATREQVLRVMGSPIRESVLPESMRQPSKGCASHLVYEDAYRNPVTRSIAGSLGATRMFEEVCFDPFGRRIPSGAIGIISY